MFKEILKEGPKLFSNNGVTREIDPSGVDKDGIPCSWTGFDKETGIFWGIPKNPAKIPKKAKKTIF